VFREGSRAGRLVRGEPFPARKCSSRLYGAGDGRFHRSSHAGGLVQAGGGVEGTTVVSGEHGRDTAISGVVVALNGVGDKGEMTDVR